MSRSPFSPVGKRMRTMNASDDSDESDEDHAGSPTFTNAERWEQESSHQSRKRSSLLNWMCRDRDLPIGVSTALRTDPFLTDEEEEDDDDDDDDADDDDDDDDDDGGGDVYENDNEGQLDDVDDSHDSSENEADDDDDDDDDDTTSSEDMSDILDGIIPQDPDDYDSDADNTGYDTADDSTIDHSLPDEYLQHDPTPDSQYPRPEWITVNELQRRRFGLPSSGLSNKSSNMYWFERNVNSSLWMIQRLERSKVLDEHTGCVNCLGFNSSGNLLCSAGDDLTVCIWDWQFNKLKKKINTGHHHNLFQSEFCNQDSSIITSSRDGTVRIVDIETGLTDALLASSGEIGKLAFITPQTLVTCGTNASVNFIDLRTKTPTKLFIVRNPRNSRTCALHSINSHPLDKHKVVVAGESPYVFLYDLRRVARNPLDTEHKPTHCIDNNLTYASTIVTSTAFNSIGDKLLISYNDDDLFVCRTDTCKAIHRYTGHRNKKTIKGCAWFGENYVLSGSDDGHIYGWDLESQHIVCFLKGDDKGVVNCLCVHPRLPVLASSGLDHNVKVWEPTSKTWPQTLKGIKPQICKNIMKRKKAQGRHRRLRALRMGSGEEIEDDPWYEGLVRAQNRRYFPAND